MSAAASEGAGGGHLFVGTSGFAYPAWAPVFYRPGARPQDLLRDYAGRLDACELNNTYYRQPTTDRIDGWVRATPATFRFTVKAQRGGSLRAFRSAPGTTLPWLVEPLRAFGERLGSVLFRVPSVEPRDDERLGTLLEAWPPGIPVAFELQDPSWERDEVHALLSAAGAALCATDLDDADPPTIRRTGRFLYLRLRRREYSPAELADWAARLVPFLEAGDDAFVFFRHDETGLSALRALELRRLTAEALGRD